MKSRLFFICSFLFLLSSCVSNDIPDKPITELAHYEYKESQIAEIPVWIEVAKNTKYSVWYGYEVFIGEPIERYILYRCYELGKGEIGSDEYLLYSSETRKLPYHTEEEKKIAKNEIFKESQKSKEQKKRIEEDKKLNPNRLEYTVTKNIDFPLLGTIYGGGSKSLTPGKVYFADRLSVFHLSRKIGKYYYIQESEGFSSYGSYDYFLIDDITYGASCEAAYMKYLGTEEVVTTRNYLRYIDVWQMIRPNPYLLRIIKENGEFNYSSIYLK